jgi:hypothetical protein
MLGRLQMTVEEAIQSYGEFAKDIFGRKKLFVQEGKYKASKLKESIQKIAKEYGQQKDTEEPLLDPRSEAEICRT